LFALLALRGKRAMARGKLPKRFSSQRVRTRSNVDQSKVVSHTIFQNHQRTESFGRLVPKRVHDSLGPYTGKNADGTKYRYRITYIQEPVPETKRNGYLARVKEGGDFVHVPNPRGLAQDERAKEKREENNKEFWTEKGSKGPDRMSGFTTWNWFCLKRETNEEWRMYFNQNRWIVCKLLPEYFRYSVVYPSKAEAMKKYNKGRVFFAGVKKYSEAKGAS